MLCPVEILNHHQFAILNMINQKVYFIHSLFFLLVFSFSSHAQKSSKGKSSDVDIDVELWGNLSYNYKFNKSWELTVGAQARGELTNLKFDQFLVEVETQYNPRFHKLVKPIRIGVGLRYIGALDDNDYENHLRLHADFLYRFKFKRLHLDYRLRGQFKDELKRKDDIYKNYWTKDLRNRIEVGYDFKKWKFDPEVFFELFFHDELGALNGFTKCRAGVKTNYKITSNHSLGVKYFMEIGMQYYGSNYDHVIVLSYQYKNKLKKRKKKKARFR